MDKEKELNIGNSAESSKTKRRSERVLKRNRRLISLDKEVPREKISKIVRETVQKKTPDQLSKEAPKKSGKRISASLHVKKRRKRKSVTYEIDCSCINMDTSDLQKDLWNRAKNGKLNFAKNVRITRRDNTILIISRSYISKKCVRSNIHFLTTTYLKKQKIDRPVHVVGNGNIYKLIYK